MRTPKGGTSIPNVETDALDAELPEQAAASLYRRFRVPRPDRLGERSDKRRSHLGAGNVTFGGTSATSCKNVSGPSR
jgi:hypothetical protein